MPSPKPFWRSLRVIEHLATGLSIALVIAAGRRFGLRAKWLPDVVRWWHARLCRALGVQVKVTGELAPNALLAANHVSWLDIPVLGSWARMDFVSKAEVRDWPVIGWMARIVGTLFIARGANQAGVLIPRLGELVRAGGRVVVFPEGTTTDGSRLQRFHPRLFAAAQLEGVLVQPVALRYGTNAAPDPIAPFVGDDALLPHLLRLVRHPGLRVHVQFLRPLDGSAHSRRYISEHCRGAIEEALGIGTADRISRLADREAAQVFVCGSLSFVEAA